ncbi:MAG: EamA family transporter [Pirellulales bacterium]
MNSRPPSRFTGPDGGAEFIATVFFAGYADCFSGHTREADGMEASGTWFFWALLSAVFAALTAVFAKVGLTGIDSDLATLVRTGIIAVVLAAFVVGTGKWANPMTLPGKTLLFLLLSALATGASWVCYFRALKIGDASKVAPVDKLSVVLVAVFAVLFLHERPSVREWLGILMVGGGVLVLALKR